MAFDISSVGYNWDKLAQADPLWSILTDEEKEGGRWSVEDFLATGVHDVSNLTDRCKELGIEFSGEKALDFGCGVGRLSSALLGFFDKVIGVDISTTMVDVGRQIHAGKPIEFVHNKSDDLSRFNDLEFDMVLTLIALQHNPPEIEEKYIVEFLRILKKGGLLVFQLPGRSYTPETVFSPPGLIPKAIAAILPGHFLERFRYFRDSKPRMDMFGMSPEKIQRLVAGNGAHIVAYDELEPISEGCPNFRYFIIKD